MFIEENSALRPPSSKGRSKACFQNIYFQMGKVLTLYWYLDGYFFLVTKYINLVTKKKKKDLNKRILSPPV